MIYLDSSAIVTLISGRRHATELRAFLGARTSTPMATSSIGFVETVRTMDRIGSYPTLLEDLVRSFTEILVTEEVRNAAAHLSGGARTLDAVHIASAQVIGGALDVLLTYDKRMLEVARDVGLPVQAPGFA